MTLTNKLKEMRRREEGFTIVELLIVIVVIAILAALVITSYLGIQGRARDAERQSDIRALATAVQAYSTINDGDYPTCAEVADGTTVDNIEPDALEPPQGGSFTAGTAASSSARTNYGCVQFPTSGNPTGLTFTYWSEATSAVVPRAVGVTE